MNKFWLKKEAAVQQDLSIFKIFAPTMIASRESDGTCRIEGVASSTVRDHHGDQLTVKALEKMAASARGMTIFLNHSYNVPDDVFGRVEKVKLARSGDRDPKTNEEIYDLRFGIKVTKSNARAVSTFEQIEGGTRLGLSIGAMVPDGGATFSKEEGGRYIVDDVELVETSVVGVPANPRSWIDYAVKALAGKYPEKLEKERASMREVLEAEGVQSQGVVDDPIDESSDPVEAPAAAPDVNDSASDNQDDNAEEGAKVPVDDNNVTTTTTVEAGFAPTTTTSNSANFTVNETVDALKTRVSVWDGDKVIEVDTGRSKPKGDGDQSAQTESDDAGGPTASTGEVTKSGEDEIALGGAVEVTLTNSRQVIASLSAQLTASRAETEEVREELRAATNLAKQAIDGTAAVIAQLSALPVGRKTGFVAAQKQFTELRQDIYDPEVQKLLTKG